MRRPVSLTKDQLLQRLYERDREVEALRRANREIDCALQRVLKTREELRQDVLDGVEAAHEREVDAARAESDDALSHLSAQVDALCERLGIDEHQWAREHWRYESQGVAPKIAQPGAPLLPVVAPPVAQERSDYWYYTNGHMEEG